MRSNIRIYWLCQVVGWLGMVLIETSNYTFFIAGKFSAELLVQFSIAAVCGLILTHGYRYFLRRTGYFDKSRTYIWAYAFLSTLVLSLLLSAAAYFPYLVTGQWALLRQLRTIDLIGNIYNWMRYVGVWIIIYFMYKVMVQNNMIQREKLKVENDAKTTELELLKAQLNPHFLFNALNSIKALVTVNPEKSRDAIVQLSELLRFTLQYSREKVIPLSEELSEVKKYLSLEQLRFGSRLEVKWLISEDTLNTDVPPAILLTLAENAVKHGINQSIRPGVISVEANLEGNLLLIRMTNTGSYRPTERRGIGLKQVKRRMEELYGTNGSFTIANAGNYVVAELKIPQ